MSMINGKKTFFLGIKGEKGDKGDKGDKGSSAFVYRHNVLLKSNANTNICFKTHTSTPTQLNKYTILNHMSKILPLQCTVQYSSGDTGVGVITSVAEDTSKTTLTLTLCGTFVRNNSAIISAIISTSENIQLANGITDTVTSV